eukprot:1285852-Prymnesium_polylepis.1
MALAFFGPPPDETYTVDHIAKYDGNFMRERSDNRIENLRWASKREQSLNRRKQKPRRDGRSVWVWRVGSPRSSGTRYDSALAAATKLGLQSNLVSRVAKKTIQKQTAGYHVEYIPQEPDKLEADERFKFVRGFRVSQYGRARDPTNSFSFTPQPNAALSYATLSRGTGDGCNTEAFAFHRLVAEAWPGIVGECPGESYTVDHIDRNRCNNRADNLRWATASTQNSNKNYENKCAKQLCLAAVHIKPPGASEWLQFESQCEASSVISRDFGVALKQSAISNFTSELVPGSQRTVYKGRFKRWSFRKPE